MAGIRNARAWERHGSRELRMRGDLARVDCRACRTHWKQLSTTVRRVIFFWDVTRETMAITPTFNVGRGLPDPAVQKRRPEAPNQRTRDSASWPILCWHCPGPERYLIMHRRKVSCLCPSQSKPLCCAERVRYWLRVGVALAIVSCSWSPSTLRSASLSCIWFQSVDDD